MAQLLADAVMAPSRNGAFDAVLKDPDFLKEAASSNIDVDPVRGVDMQAFVKKVLATPKHLAAKARELIE